MPWTFAPSAVAQCSSAGRCARSRRPVLRSGATPHDRQLIRPTQYRAIFSRFARLGSVCAERAEYPSSIAERPHTIPGKTATDPLRGICGTLARTPEPTMLASSAAMPHYTAATSPIALLARGSVQSGFNEVAPERPVERRPNPATSQKPPDSRIGLCLTPGAATDSEVAVTAFAPLLGLLADVPDPRRGQGQLYKLPHLLLFSILAIVRGCNSYRGIVTFIDVHRHKLNATFGLRWRRAPAYTAVRYILKGLDPADVEMAFRRHAALLQAARATPGKGSIALDGKTLRGSFDNFRDRAASQVLSAFATDTSLVLAHVDVAEKSNEIPAAQTLLAELGVADGAIVTLDALHCQKNTSRSPAKSASP